MANTRPATPLPTFATDANYTSGPDNTLATKVAMVSGEQSQGFFRTGRAAARKVNWLLNKLGAWIEWGSLHWLDGENGGTWNPDAFITIGGAGAKIADGLFIVDAAADGAIFGCQVVIDCAGFEFQVLHSSHFLGPVVCDDVVTFGNTATFNTAAAFNAGAVLTGGFLFATSGISITPTTTDIGTGSGIVQCTAPTTLNDRRDPVVYAPNADHTFAYSDGMIIVAKSGVISAPRVWTLGDGHLGNRLTLLNFSSSVITIHASGGGSLLAGPATLPAYSSPTPGMIELVWVDTGTGTETWCGK